MRILFSSCLPFDHGGYPNQLNYLMGRLHRYGATLGAICWNFTLEYRPVPVPLDEILQIEEMANIAGDMDIEMYRKVSFYSTYTPKGNHENFWKKLETFYHDFKPDIILFYQDIFIFPNYNIGKLHCKKYLWMPVHDDFHENSLIPSHIADPEGRYTDSTFRFLPLFDKIAAFSQFGKDVLEGYGYPTTLIYHAIDPKVWRVPKNEATRRKLLSSIGIPPDYFICLIVANNMELSNRKAFDYNMIAYSKFAKIYPKSKLIIKSNMHGAAKLWEIAKSLGISNNILNISEKVLRNDMLCIYQISNVLLSASKSEGFGIPIVEAQMCGVPVITTNCTAMPEITHLGICTKPKEVSTTVGVHNSWSHPDSDEIFNAICRIYKGDYPKVSVPSERYDPDILWEQWKKFLELS